MAEENPDFEFDYEFVPNANIGEKTSQYMATDNLPDVYKEWGGTVDFENKIKKGMLAPIWDSPEQANEEGYDYPDGSLTKWQLSDGTDTGVYAGVVNFDFFVWFYNGELFEKEGWSEPESWQDLIDLLDDMTAKGYVPMSMSGKDPYGAYIIDELIMRVTGEIGVAEKIISGEGTFTDNADVRKAFEYAKELVDHNVNGGTDWLAQDYAGCRGLFVNGQIPMMYLVLGST